MSSTHPSHLPQPLQTRSREPTLSPGPAQTGPSHLSLIVEGLNDVHVSTAQNLGLDQDMGPTSEPRLPAPLAITTLNPNPDHDMEQPPEPHQAQPTNQAQPNTVAGGPWYQNLPLPPHPGVGTTALNPSPDHDMEPPFEARQAQSNQPEHRQGGNQPESSTQAGPHSQGISAPPHAGVATMATAPSNAGTPTQQPTSYNQHQPSLPAAINSGSTSAPGAVQSEIGGPVARVGRGQYRRRPLRESDFVRRAPVTGDEAEDLDDGDLADGEADDEQQPLNQRDLRNFFEQISQSYENLNNTMTRAVEMLATTTGQQAATNARNRVNARRGTLTREPRLTTAPSRRSADENTFSGSIRGYLVKLVRGKGNLLVPSVTPTQVRAFELTLNSQGEELQGPCCTPADFRFNLLGTPHDAWNRSAARVFARDYIQYYHLEPRVSTARDIMEAFATRIKSLRRQYNEARRNAHLLAVISSQESRREQRKRNLFHRRLEIAQVHPKLQQHVRIIQRLGVNGMSSDESDHEEATGSHAVGARRPTYHVLLPQWRARDISKWLHIFDSVYSATRRLVGPSRGDYPRIRQYNEREPRFSHNSRIVADLPRSAYSNEWLRGRNPDFLDLAVRPTQERYVFLHSNDVLELFLQDDTQRDTAT